MPSLGKEEEKDEEFYSCWATFCNPDLRGHEGVSLGLSGGLDSRVLFSSCRRKDKPFEVFTFGDAQEPDVQVAKQIAVSEGVPISHFDDPVPDADSCVEMMKEYAAVACINMPVSSIIRLRYFDRLRHRKRLMIDGGFGELSRRQYLNRLYWKGKKALLSNDVQSIVPYLMVPRAHVFTEEVERSMRLGLEEELTNTLMNMPPSREFGIGNFLDLLAIRTRVPNWGSAEQARLDAQVVNYMPFVQPSLLRNVFALPVSLRANGKLFRRFIRMKMPSLASFPLVKGDTTYPFRLNTVEAWMWTKAKTKLGLRYQDTTRAKILDKIRSFVLDAVESHSVKSLGVYDYKAIRQLVFGYYDGRHEMAGAVDWWLTFELWRQSVRAV
jgi:hypothetical protein